MNNKLAFILPRVAAVTLIAGLGALVLFVVFKLLVFLLAVALIVVAAKGIAGIFRSAGYRNEDSDGSTRAGITPLAEPETIVPVVVRPKPAIIPIG